MTTPAARAAGPGRRSSQEVHDRLIDAARALFTEHGYAATTKEIAARAEVSETLIFRRFGSKAELFRATVVEAFGEFVEEFVARWEADPVDAVIEDISTSYFEGLYRMARENRRLLRTLMTGSEIADATLREVSEAMSRHFANSLGRVQRVVRIGGAARGYRFDEPVSIAASAAMVISLAVYDDWFLPDECREVARDRLIREMVGMCVHGIAHRPAPDAPPAPPG
jgi:AcrR family transcriptional regulator